MGLLGISWDFMKDGSKGFHGDLQPTHDGEMMAGYLFDQCSCPRYMALLPAIFMGHSWDICIHMCHGQNMVWFPIEGDGHPTIDTDLDTHYKDSYCGMDDHKPYTMF